MTAMSYSVKHVQKLHGWQLRTIPLFAHPFNLPVACSMILPVEYYVYKTLFLVLMSIVRYLIFTNFIYVITRNNAVLHLTPQPVRYGW